jgi:hypothetical protein
MIKTENVFRDKELDQGFILKANDKVSTMLKTMLAGGATDCSQMEIVSLAPHKRTFGL